MSTDAQVEAATAVLLANGVQNEARARAVARAALAAAQAGAPDWQQLEEWIVMADNRLEVADCPGCVDVARSYLQEALTTIRSLRPPAAQAESFRRDIDIAEDIVKRARLRASEPAGAPSEEDIEAMALAAHRAFWLRTYGEETGTAASVARQTWEAAREGRVFEARASYLALLQRERKE